MNLRSSFCTECMNFACTINRVETEIRAGFFSLNPEIAKAWD